ncbi:MAG: DUF5714 domain-containing protein [Dehalococcoidales bacterium]|nr:DUF5714 domain-containing protein [Dehalococcoidales bacterium]
MPHKVNCLICGTELKYENDYRPMECALCGQTFESNVACEKGHFVCDACHSLPGGDFIVRFCIASNSKNPIEQAIILMKDPRLAMHGPEHHVLVPAVLLSAYYNVTGETDKKEAKIKLAQRRASLVPGGFCGYQGDCGAAVGVGIFISILTGSTPLSTKEWRLSNLGTAHSLLAIAEKGGPRCCKRNTFLAILEATKFVKEQFNVTLSTSNDVKCVFSPLNKECIKEKCSFHLNDRDVN